MNFTEIFINFEFQFIFFTVYFFLPHEKRVGMAPTIVFFEKKKKDSSFFRSVNPKLNRSYNHIWFQQSFYIPW